MKNKFTKFLALSIFLFSLATLTYAQAQPYQLLVPSLPGIGAQQTTLTTYIPAAFRLAIGASAVLAFVMITFGGIMYATADAITQKQQGREYLTNAVVGLLLVIGAYAILYTIDPGILAIDLVMKRPPTAAPPPSTEVVPTGPTPCVNCVTFSSLKIPAKSPGGYVNQAFAMRLAELNEGSTKITVPWYVTEAYGQGHTSSCHRVTGTCADIAPVNGHDVNAINAVIRGLVNVGLTNAQFEVLTLDDKKNLENGCGSCKPPIPKIDSRIKLVVSPINPATGRPWATGWHFHVNQ